MPWTLTRDELEQFTDHGLEIVSLEDYIEQEEKPIRRFRAVFRAPYRSLQVTGAGA